MKIILANSQVPFITGGAENLGYGLEHALKDHGHHVETVRLPFKWYPPERIPEHILAARLFDLTESSGDKIDLLIGLKFPAYFLKHPNKVLWILHQHRPVYDLWGTPYQDIPNTLEGINIRNTIINADNNLLREAKKIFTISKTVTDRLKKFNNIASQTLYHPPKNYEQMHSESFDNYVLYPSRISILKRQQLVINAMKYTKSPLKLFIAGRPDSEYILKLVTDEIKKNHLEDKVKLLGEVSEDDKIRLYANSRAVVFTPFNEDYGYITLEAFYSKKPVITCSDSGGPLEFVDNGANGLVVEADPKAIAEAMDKYSDPASAESMGKNAYEKIVSMDISWDNVVKALTQ